ncbi:MAG: lipopolysaccharide biosynthesis protein [Acidobacteria bacterium]|nr:lipopolysaccharide biosynthesis protein [Acidobacteriota bacterium]
MTDMPHSKALPAHAARQGGKGDEHTPHPAKKKSYSGTALAALFWTHSRRGIAALIALPTAVILARLLSPAEFGIAAAALFFGRLAARLSSLGMGSALIRTKVLRDDHLATVFVFSAAMGIVTYVVLVLSGGAIGRFYGNDAIGSTMPVVGLLFLIPSFFTVQQALLSRDLRYRELATSGTVEMLVTSVSACIMAWAGLGFWSLVLGGPLGEAAKGAFSAYYARWRPSVRWSRAAFRELLSFGFGSYTTTILVQLAGSIDNLVIGRVLGVTALGFYDKGYSVAHRLFNKLSAGGPTLSFRIFSIIEDEPERFRRAYRKVILASTLVGYPAFAVLVALAHPLFLVLFGEQWLPAVVPFQILCLAAPFNLTNGYASAAAQARGWVWSQAWRQVVVVALIASGVYAASPWGVTGAAAAVLGATVTGWVLMQHLLRSATHFTWSDILGPQVPALTCSIALVSLLTLGQRLLLQLWPALEPWQLLLVLGTAGCAAYLLFLRYSRFTEASSLVHETLTAVSPKLARFVRAA